MSTSEDIIKKILSEYLFDANNPLNERIIDRLLRNQMIYLPISFTTSKKESKLITKDDRIEILEEKVRKLNKDFEFYLKTEFKEESNRVFLESIEKYDQIKEVHLKYLGNNIRYYIIYKDENYVDFLSDIIDIELTMEDSYPMLIFEFLHYSIDDLSNINLSGTYTVLTKEA